jgi:hypothetical protein
MTDLPDGQISRSSDKPSVQLSTPFAKNISLRDLLDAALLIPAVPPRLKRGVSRSSRTWSAGCGGRGSGARRAALTRTAKSCGPDAPTLASTGDDASHHAGMVTTSPVHQGEHEGNRKTIAQGRPDRSGEPVVTNSYVFYFYIRGCGCIRRPAFPAPSFLEGQGFFASPGRCPRRGIGRLYPVVIARSASDEAILMFVKQSTCSPCRFMDCFAVARNDGSILGCLKIGCLKIES